MSIRVVQSASFRAKFWANRPADEGHDSSRNDACLQHQTALEDACGACHGPDIVVGLTGSRNFWQDTVDTMRGRGASGSDDDFKVIVEYLAKYFGVPVNVNTAAGKDLAADLVISSDEADAIVKYRTDKGKFKDWTELAKVPGLDIKKLEPIKTRIKF